MDKWLNKIIQGDCLEVMREMPDNCVDLTVTSPPYDNLRDYKGFSFDFEGIAKELFRITTPGGVLVWVVGDQTTDGSESGTSFRQALFFKDIGFNLHDTMIYKKDSPFPSSNRYQQVFEYMFVLSKGKPKTFNPLKERKLCFSRNTKSSTFRDKKGNIKKSDAKMNARFKKANEQIDKVRENVWKIDAGYMKSSKDILSFEHPATFPEKLAADHIFSWSKEGEIVLDPFMGSGTTAKMAKSLNRKYIGIEISKEYIQIAETRLSAQPSPMF